MNWFKKLTKSEQKLLTYGGLIVFIALFWAFIFKPVNATLLNNYKKISNLTVEYKQMEDAKPLLEKQKFQSNKYHRELNKPFITWIDEQLEENTLSNFVTRSEPKDNQTLILTFEAVSFDSLASWLQKLEQNYRVNITEADFNLTDRSNGLCNARLTIEDKI